MAQLLPTYRSVHRNSATVQLFVLTLVLLFVCK